MIIPFPSSESIIHLGYYDLIDDVFDELDTSKLIDDFLFKKSDHKIPYLLFSKQRALTDWGLLSVVSACLDFFENLLTERLLGEGVLPEHLNDNVFW